MEVVGFRLRSAYPPYQSYAFNRARNRGFTDGNAVRGAHAAPRGDANCRPIVATPGKSYGKFLSTSTSTTTIRATAFPKQFPFLSSSSEARELADGRSPFFLIVERSELCCDLGIIVLGQARQQRDQRHSYLFFQPRRALACSARIALVSTQPG